MSAEYVSSFGPLLKRHRLAAGLSQEELASRTGLSPHGISDLERGARRTPRPSTLRLLAEALGLTGDDRGAFLRAAAGVPDTSASETLAGLPAADAATNRLGEGAARPDRSASFPPPRHNLPIPPTPLLGREREAERVKALLRRDDVRLVTITGTGGVGKTRLALRVATELAGSIAAPFPDGVWWVPLAHLTDAARVLPAIAGALDLRENAGQSSADVLRAHLRERALLLLLDNFEQVGGAALEVAALLAACPGLKVLVTSRTGLHVRGEHEYAMSPLALPPDLVHLPPPDQLSQYAAVALFVARAQAVRADFRLSEANAAVVATICARLDGLPLAIELAAARVKLLPPAKLLRHLTQLVYQERRDTLLGWGPRDLEERQRTMQRTIAWSYDLLSAAERRLFRRLSVFLGGWTLEAAEAICAAPPETAPLALDVLEGLSVLVDQSLVRQRTETEGEDEHDGEEPRFAMLHVIREYALEQLEASDEADEVRATREAHATFFADRAREAALALGSRAGEQWRVWLRRERDNLHGALAWLREEGSLNRALWIGTALAHDDITRGSYTEARRRIESLLAAAAGDGTVDPEARLLATNRARIFASMQRDFAREAKLSQEQLALAREIGNPLYIADMLADLALLALDRGASDEAACYAEESLEVAHQTGNPATIAFALENLALARLDQGKLAEARALAQEGLELSRGVDFLWGQGINAGTLALIRCREADPMGALEVMREGYAPLRTHGGLHGLAGVLQIAAGAWAVAGDACRSARLFGAAEAAMTHAEGGLVLALQRMTEELAAPARAELGEEQWARAFAEGRALSLEEALAEGLNEIPTR